MISQEELTKKDADWISEEELEKFVKDFSEMAKVFNEEYYKFRGLWSVQSDGVYIKSSMLIQIAPVNEWVFEHNKNHQNKYPPFMAYVVKNGVKFFTRVWNINQPAEE